MLGLSEKSPSGAIAYVSRVVALAVLRLQANRDSAIRGVLLFFRHSGMRIGEAADLSFNCLHASGADQWTIHVPLGKLKPERMVPVDSFVCELVQHRRSFSAHRSTPGDVPAHLAPRRSATLL
jgi:integrase